MCALISNISAGLRNAMEFEASSTSSTSATSLDSTSAAATTTAGTIVLRTINCISKLATTSVICTIASNLSPVSLCLRCYYNLAGIASPIDISDCYKTLWRLQYRSTSSYCQKFAFFEINNLFSDICDAVNGLVIWLPNCVEQSSDWNKLK